MESTESLNLDFQKLWLILKRRWLPATGVFSCVVGLAVVVVLLQKPVYKAEGKLLIKRVNQTSAVTGLGEQIGELESVGQQSNPLKTEAAVVASIPLVEKTITALNLKDDEGEPPKPEDLLKKKIKVKALTGTDVLQISYKSNDPQEAAAVVNKLMNLYIENNIVTHRAAAVTAGEFIAKQLPENEARVRKAEVALRKFKEKNHVVNLDEEAKSAVEVIKNLESQITQAQAELGSSNARSAMLHDKVAMNSQESIALNTLNQAPGVQKVLEEFQQVEGELAVQETRFTEGHPSIEALKDKREALKALLQGRIQESVGNQGQVPTGNLQEGDLKQKLTEDFVKSEVERLGLASRLADLTKAEYIYKQRINILPKLEQDERELQRQLNAAQSTYEVLLKKLQEVRVAENQNMGNARVLEAALVPNKRSLLKPAIILVLGDVLGILFAGATVALLEVRDRSIKTLKEAKELFGYTFLGAIPSLSKKATPRGKDTEWTVPELPVRDTPRAPISEAYRMLQANLKFLGSDKALQVIVVTSSVPREGKSTVSANLAAAMAQLGHRVLLVDADMRRPSQHHIWGLTNSEGLSDVIVTQGEFKTAVKKVMPSLDFLPAGVIPPNPTALLDSKRMASLIEDFSKTYDFVIIDSPPLVVAADALTLGKMTDGVLLVARPGVSDFNSATRSKELLDHSGLNVLGLVANGVILENESDSYFYFAREYYVEEISTTRKLSSANRKAVYRD